MLESLFFNVEIPVKYSVFKNEQVRETFKRDEVSEFFSFNKDVVSLRKTAVDTTIA